MTLNYVGIHGKSNAGFSAQSFKRSAVFTKSQLISTLPWRKISLCFSHVDMASHSLARRGRVYNASELKHPCCLRLPMTRTVNVCIFCTYEFGFERRQLGL